MKTKSKKPGQNTSAEVSHISPHGIWVLIGGKEYFLPYSDYPWFADARLSEIHHLEILHGAHLRWPALDVDLELESLEHPAGYPLIDKGLKAAK